MVLGLDAKVSYLANKYSVCIQQLSSELSNVLKVSGDLKHSWSSDPGSHAAFPCTLWSSSTQPHRAAEAGQRRRKDESAGRKPDVIQAKSREKSGRPEKAGERMRKGA